MFDLEEMGFENIIEDMIMIGEIVVLIVMEYGFELIVDDGVVCDF